MWSRTKQIFQKRPLLMNVASFGTMYVTAEIGQQYVLLKTSPTNEKRSIDWACVGRYAAIGMVGIAPFLYGWYRVLDTLVPAKNAAAVAKKVLMDQTFSSTTCLSIFYVGMSLLENRDDVFAELKAKFWSTYKMSCMFWLPAQTINFAFLPAYTRVAFVGAASFVWVNILCFVKRQEFAPEPETENAVESSEQSSTQEELIQSGTEEKKTT